MMFSKCLTMEGRVRKKEEKALHVSAWVTIKANKPEELRKLLSEDKSKELIRRSGGNVLSYCLCEAIGHNQVECVRVLLEAGANPDVFGKCYPLQKTIIYGHHEIILTMLLEYGADPNLKSYDPRCLSLLCTAAFIARVQYFRTLLLYGADPDYNCSDRNFLKTFPNARSVLGACLKKGYEAPFVKLLIDFGANMYLPDIQESLSRADKEAREVLEREKAHPRSLKSQCRLMIRRVLRQNGKILAIDQLEIPNVLRKYLQYHMELTEPETLPRYEEQYKGYFRC